MVLTDTGTARVHFFWHEFTLCGGEVLARYEGDTPAIIARQHGKGRAVLAGTEVFRQYIENPQKAITALLRKEIRASAVTPSARLSGDTNNVEVATLSGPGGTVVFLLNHNTTAINTVVQLRDDGSWKHMETDKIFDLTQPLTIEAETVLPLIKEG